MRISAFVLPGIIMCVVLAASGCNNDEMRGSMEQLKIDNAVLKEKVANLENKLATLENSMAKVEGTVEIVADVEENKKLAYNMAAQAAGRNAKLAQEVYYNDRFTTGGMYANRLEHLLAYDKNLNDDPKITFTFGAVNSQGYTFFTRHALGTENFRFTD